jgi:hypothetical protein
MCRGNGICTRIPCTFGSAFSRSTCASSAFSGGLSRQTDRFAAHPGFLARLSLRAHVHGARWIIAHEDDRQPGCDAERLEALDLRRDVAPHEAPDGRAIDQQCCVSLCFSVQNPPPAFRE